MKPMYHYKIYSSLSWLSKIELFLKKFKKWETEIKTSIVSDNVIKFLNFFW